MQETSAGSRTRGRPKTTFFNGRDTHWTRYSCILKIESSGHSSFIAWAASKRMAESKASKARADGADVTAWLVAAPGVQSVALAYTDVGIAFSSERMMYY